MPWNDCLYILVSLVALRLAWKLQYPKPRVKETMKRKLISEVIELVIKTKSRKEKVDIIKSNLCRGLVGILRLNFDADLKLDIDLEVKYRANRKNVWDETLNHSSKTWAVYLAAAPYQRSKKNLKFRSMLERLEPREAQLFLDAANRKLSLGISRHTLSRCFPEIFKTKTRTSEK